LSIDEAKAIVLDTCKSPLEMDIAQMRRGLAQQGFSIIEFERLTDPDPHTLQQYMVWIESANMELQQAKTGMAAWLQGMPEFPWVGKWDFVVKYARMNMAYSEFTVRITRYSTAIYQMHGLNIRIPWPERSRRELLNTTAWQRPLIYGD
jgi:hypothetical protein